uniref:Succinate dehydrogenase subunit 4 n=1 Tax=Gracilaria gracilis TaxID=2777 RepID=A0A345UB97_GRAGA|nr:succinate dehydrogenase subunit 4 [Gracilaria gracilis]AXI97733.1 succinate dehydrogenase subunit 4 [Gracilaria gracilis]
MFDIVWSFMRLGGIFFFSGILLDIEIIVLVVGLVVLHMNFGLKAILTDYIHTNKIKVALLVLVRISSIEIGRYILELLL